jgi:methionyl-tRNA formyltransferase
MTSAVVFAYSEVGVRCLRVLLRHDVRIALVITHDDDPTEQRWFASVAELARAHEIPVLLPGDPNEPAVVAAIARLQPDFLFSFYYRHMLSEQLLATAKRGALNMHGSLLPRYRGRAPVNWAILHGETETGASLHYMEARPDAGPLVGQAAVAILLNDTALDVSLKVAAAAERLLDQHLPDLIRGRAPRIALDIARGSYFGGRRPEDGRISWERPALEIHNLIRAVAPPFPGAFGSCGRSILRALGSRYLDQAARHRQGAPCLYAESGALHLDCLDGKRLTLTVAELAGEPLTPAALLAHYGPAPVSLASSHNNSPDGIA